MCLVQVAFQAPDRSLCLRPRPHSDGGWNPSPTRTRLNLPLTVAASRDTGYAGRRARRTSAVKSTSHMRPFADQNKARHECSVALVYGERSSVEANLISPNEGLFHIGFQPRIPLELHRPGVYRAPYTPPSSPTSTNCPSANAENRRLSSFSAQRSRNECLAHPCEYYCTYESKRSIVLLT